jgi:hypothetical protein
MLFFRSDIEVPELGATYRSRTACHPFFVVKALVFRGVVFDDALIAPAMRPWPTMTLTVQVRALVRGDGGTYALDPASVCVVADGATFRSRPLEGGMALAVQCDPAWCRLPPASPRALGPADNTRLSAIGVALLESRTSADAAPHVDHLFQILRAIGAPIPPVDRADLRAPLPRPVEAAIEGMNSILSTTGEAARSVDLEGAMRRSPRQVNRVLGEIARARGFGERNWRDIRNKDRLGVGLLLMSSPRATTELVARKLGCASPTVLCRAFAEAGLPSPGGVRDTLASLV